MMQDAYSDKIRPTLSDAEIYEYKGVQFGILWDDKKECIMAIELQTGHSAAVVSRQGTKSPKKDLLSKIAYFVDSTDYKQSIRDIEQEYADLQENIDKQIRELQKQREWYNFPINEKVRL